MNQLYYISIIVFYFSIIKFEQKKSKVAISLNTMILIYALLYSLGSIVDDRAINKAIPVMLILSSLVIYVFSVLTEYILCANETKKTVYDTSVFFNRKFKLCILILVFICIITFLYVFLYRLNLFDFIYSSRGGRSLLLKKLNLFMFFKDVIAAIYILSLILYRLTKDGFYKRLMIFCGIFTLIYALITISRSHLALVALSTIYIFSMEWKGRHGIINAIMIIGVFLASIWKWLLSSIIFKGEVNFESFNIDIPSELIHWSNITNNMLTEELQYGKSFFDGFISMLYPFYDATPLSVWYVNKYEPLIAEIGGGRGFSILAESILNFGYLGIPIVFISMGVIIGIFTFLSKRSVLFFYLVATMIPIMHKVYRSEFLSLTKTWWWYMALPIIIIYFMQKVKIKVK